MLPSKIVCIGAGSDAFGLNTLVTLLRSQQLRGCHLALVDRDSQALDLVARLADRLNAEWDAGMTLSAHSHHTDALDDAAFVILAIEVSPREALWRSDYEIPLKYNVRQPYAENGGPGGFAHAARNIGPVLEIVREMERTCPDALLINFTNPMQRICDAVARYSAIQVVGLCHQISAGYAMVGRVLCDELGIDIPSIFSTTHSTPGVNEALRQVALDTMEKVDIIAAGLNHFTWMLALHERKSGRDLYPLFARRWKEHDPAFEPLTRRIYQAFGLFPIPGDEHLCEYLPWVSDPRTRPWEKYDISLYEWELRSGMRGEGRGIMALMGAGEMGIDHLRTVPSEGVAELIKHVAGADQLLWPAVNLPNQGYISNLPSGAIVEVPGVMSGAGVLGVGVGPLPEPIAELCRREITVSQLCVDAAIHGDRDAALQCLLLDPVITDLDLAQLILDDYLESYRQYLPAFWT
jgi:alpha-galactosidase